MSHSIETPIEYQKRYTIRIGSDLYSAIAVHCRERYTPRQAFLVVDEQVLQLHGNRLNNEFQAIFDRVEVFTVPEGEKSKELSIWQELVDFLLTHGAERNTPLFAIGGGVTGDLAGFAASAVLRGIPLVHLPTSLLAMVDSSIGGKTGVNHTTGKNLVGAFYQPDAVFADLEFLSTLKPREWINGLSEILKYGAIHSPEIFSQVSALISGPGFRPAGQWGELIAKSAAIKVEIVREDTLEAGKRAFLNFGHTFAHALEKESGYGEISHGEAVFAGMLAATYASRELGADIEVKRFKEFEPLYKLSLPGLVADKDRLIRAMRTDKKVKDGDIRLVLLNGWGDPMIHTCEGTGLIEAAWDFVYERFS